MDIRQALSVKSLKKLLTITACHSHKNKRKPKTSKRKRSQWVWISRTLKALVKNYGIYSDLTEQDPLSTQKASINSFVNLKIEYLQKINIIWFMKLAVVPAKQSTWWIKTVFEIVLRWTQKNCICIRISRTCLCL